MVFVQKRGVIHTKALKTHVLFVRCAAAARGLIYMGSCTCYCRFPCRCAPSVPHPVPSQTPLTLDRHSQSDMRRCCECARPLRGVSARLFESLSLFAQWLSVGFLLVVAYLIWEMMSSVGKGRAGTELSTLLFTRQ